MLWRWLWATVRDGRVPATQLKTGVALTLLIRACVADTNVASVSHVISSSQRSVHHNADHLTVGHCFRGCAQSTAVVWRSGNNTGDQWVALALQPSPSGDGHAVDRVRFVMRAFESGEFPPVRAVGPAGSGVVRCWCNCCLDTCVALVPPPLCAGCDFGSCTCSHAGSGVFIGRRR